MIIQVHCFILTVENTMHKSTSSFNNCFLKTVTSLKTPSCLSPPPLLRSPKGPSVLSEIIIGVLLSVSVLNNTSDTDGGGVQL